MNDPTLGRGRLSGMGRLLAYLGAAAAGFVVAVVLVVDPFHVHPLDEAVAELLGRHRPIENPGTESGEGVQLWTCGMHPQVIEKQPGNCPICGMKLVPVREPQNGTPSSTPATGKDREILFYRNPMDPTVTSPVPMKDSMGMDYVPVYADEAQAAKGQGPVVRIDPTVVQNMGVTTEKVTRGDVRRQVRTVGYLDYDQEKMVSITTKYQGFVEKVYVNHIGQPVHKGDPLFEVYSPALVQTEQELLSAIDFAHRMQDAPDDARRRAEDLVEAGRKRLEYWDISDEQVRRLEQTRQVVRTLTVTSPVSGLVMKRTDGLEGMEVRPGMDVIHIADLSSLWLDVEIFDDQLPWVHLNSPVTVSLTYFPGETFEGRVHFIEPSVSEKTRTVTVTLRVPNRNGRLRAGMYATVLFEPVVAHDVVVVPSQAVLRTGERNLVVLALGGGRFAPREVELGAEGDGWVQVLSGLSEGEQLVTSSQFLLDSESNLQEAIEKMVAARAEHEP